MSLQSMSWQASGFAAADQINAFFRRISIFLPTHAAQDALSTQANECFRRIVAALRDRKSYSLSTSATRPMGAVSPVEGHSPPASAVASRTPTVVQTSEIPQHADLRGQANGQDSRRIFKWTVDLDEA